MEPTTPASLDDLLIQLKITNRLLTARLKQDMQQNEIVAMLASTGASHKEIADVLDTTSAVVATTLSRLRKQGRISST